MERFEGDDASNRVAHKLNRPTDHLTAEIRYLLAPEIEAVMHRAIFGRFVFQAGSRLITSAEAEQINGIGGCVFSQHGLVEAPVVGVGPEAVDEEDSGRIDISP